VLELGAGGFGGRFRRPEGLVGSARNAVPFIEALVVRQAAILAAEMPFAERPRSVSGGGKRLGDGDLPLCQPVEASADRHRMRAGTNGKASGHQRRAARAALRL